MRAAFHLKPVLLELGGKNYVIVLDDADCDTATDMILEGAFRNVSQSYFELHFTQISRGIR